MIPEKIGKYTVLELLGRGGMGEVYLGEDPYIGRRVAIKIIKGADPDARERFLHEARVIGGLAHPAIVSLLDFDFSGDEPFLVMELLKGESLDRWLLKPHTLAEQLLVLEDICEALAFAHENGVLHRDVKPSNVQILQTGHAKLMDFGIARAAAGKLTATGAVMGTPEYMAPEILNDAAYSPRSDLYACALLIYEMFTGRNPFAAKTVAATLTNVLTLNPPDLREVRPELPRRLATALMACLHKEPALRPEGFTSLLAAAREAGSGSHAAPVPETRALSQERMTPIAPARGAEPARPKPRWAWFGGVGAATVLLLAWGVTRNAPPAGIGAEASPSVTPALIAVPTPPPSPTPTPEIERPPIAAPRPTRSAQRPESPPAGPVTAAPVEAVATPLARPSATPLPPAPSPTPTPRPSVSLEPPPSAPPAVADPAQVGPQAPAVDTVSPRAFRRGSSVVLAVTGKGLTRGLTASILQGRRQAAGIKVVRVDFVGPELVRVTVLSEPEVPLGSYTLVFQGAGGVSTQGLQIEVLL